MSEPVVVNLEAFRPYNGGQGVRLAVTSTTASALIPGLAGGEPNDRRRVLIVNSSLYSSAFVRLGQSGVRADTGSLEVMARSSMTLTPQYTGPGAVYIAAICNAGESTNLNICAGQGT